MKNAYEVLGMEPQLEISDDEVSAAFRDAVRRVHPDAGGREGEFEELQRAREILASPSKRLRHWMGLRGVALDSRGSVSAGLMDFFVEIGAAMQLGEVVIRKRDAARSALAKALLEGELLEAREVVERMQARVGEQIGAGCGGFGAIESGGDAEQAAVLARDLAFLEKWRDALRGVFVRLV